MKLIKYDYATSDQLGTDGAYNNTYQSLCSSECGTNKGSNSLSSIGAYNWNGNTNNNIWSESNLNTINLNTNFKNYLQNVEEKDWTQYIVENRTWQVGGNTWTKIATTTGVKNVYTAEITNPSTNDTVTTMFGLMYISDYMYAADPTQVNAWSALNGNNAGSTAQDFRVVVNYNWMYMGLYDWTITRRSDGTFRVFYIGTTGYMGGNYSEEPINGVRPCFYLKPEVELAGGNGTKENPYRIA